MRSEGLSTHKKTRLTRLILFSHTKEVSLLLRMYAKIKQKLWIGKFLDEKFCSYD